MTDSQPDAPAIPDWPAGGDYDVWGADFGHASNPQDYWRRKAQPVIVTEPASPVAAALDRETVRQVVSDAIEESWWSQGGPASEKVMAAISPLLERAVAAEAKLAEIRAVLLEGGQDAATVRRRALAVIGSEEEGNQ